VQFQLFSIYQFEPKIFRAVALSLLSILLKKNTVRIKELYFPIFCLHIELHRPTLCTASTHWIGGWMDPSTSLDTAVKRKIPSPCTESNPARPACSLYLLSYRGSGYKMHMFIFMWQRPLKVKVKLSLCFNWAPRYEGVLGEWRCSFTHSLTSALGGGELSVSRPGRFTPKERVPSTQWIGGWVGPRAVLDAVVREKFPAPAGNRTLEPRSSSP
jgi:hypothetical protein